MSESASIPASPGLIENTLGAWGNCLPILHELRHGLKRLARSGETTQIDLSSIPFAPGDEQRLLEILGEGEVEANVDALGPTRVWESGIHGIWLVDYRNIDGQRLALHIEIATVPNILRTQPQDIKDAIDKLEALVETASDDSNPRS